MTWLVVTAVVLSGVALFVLLLLALFAITAALNSGGEDWFGQ